jgi:hypothetical protein
MLYFVIGRLKCMTHGKFDVSVLGFSGATYWSYFTKLETEEAYVTFLE